MVDDPEKALKRSARSRRFSVRARQSVTDHFIRADAIISPIQAEKTGYQGQTSLARCRNLSLCDQLGGMSTKQRGEIG